MNVSGQLQNVSGHYQSLADTSWMGRWAAREEKNQVVLFLAISTLG